MLAMCWGLGMRPQKQRVLSEGGDHCYLCVRRVLAEVELVGETDEPGLGAGASSKLLRGLVWRR